MAYQLTVEEHPNYVHVVAEGDRTPENAQRFLKDAFAACMRTGRTAVLLDMRLTGPALDYADILRVISERSADGARLRKVAYVQAFIPDPSRPAFAETVALNRAVPARLFPDVASAARWLDEP